MTRLTKIQEEFNKKTKEHKKDLPQQKAYVREEAQAVKPKHFSLNACPQCGGELHTICNTMPYGYYEFTKCTECSYTRTYER